MWSANKCQAETLVSIQLGLCKYILGYSETTCDEPVYADLGLKTLKNSRDFVQLKDYSKVTCMCMNNTRLMFKLISNEWDKVKCNGCLGKPWLVQVDSLQKALDHQDKVLDTRIKPLIRMCEEFEMSLQYKSKLQLL